MPCLICFDFVMWLIYFFHTFFARTSSTTASQYQHRVALWTGSGPEAKGKNCFLPAVQTSGGRRAGRLTCPLLPRLPSLLLMRIWHLFKSRKMKGSTVCFCICVQIHHPGCSVFDKPARAEAYRRAFTGIFSPSVFSPVRTRTFH